MLFRSVAPRRAFGTTMAFDVAAAGTAALEYRTSMLRTLWVLLVGLAWLVLVAATTRLRWRHLVGWRAPLPELDDTTSIADWRTPLPMPIASDPAWSDDADSLVDELVDEGESGGALDIVPIVSDAIVSEPIASESVDEAGDAS